MTEAQIQRQIVLFLEQHNWIVNKIIQCTKNGWVDIEAIRQHPEMVFIEVKRPGQKPKPLQEYRHNKLKKLGWTVITATSLEDVKHLK